jgi:hypothetical protein
MRSQVQVLAGPPPSSQVTALPAPSQERSTPAWAALGPHTPSPPAPPVPRRGRPPGRQARRRPPTVVAPQPEDASHASGAATSRCRLPLVPTAPPPATGAPHPGLAHLVAVVVTRGRRGPQPNPAARVRHRPPPDQPDLGSVARVPASWTVDRAVDGPAATGASTGSGGQGRPTSSTLVPTPPPEHGGDGRVRTDGAATGRLDTGGVDSGRLDAGRVDSGRPTAGPAGRRSQVTGQRTAGQPDPGHRTRMGGHRLLDTGDRRRGVSAGRVDHGDDARPPRSRLEDAAPGRRRLGERQPGPLPSRDAEGPTLGRMGLAAAATVSCRWYAAVQLAPRRTAFLG